MTQTAFVVNHGQQPYREKWKGEYIELAPGEEKEMERLEAIAFLGTFAAEVKDGNGDTISGKTLHLKENGDPWAAKGENSWISQVDGLDYGSEAALKAHYAGYKHLQLVKDVSEEVLAKTPLTTGKAIITYACEVCDFTTKDKGALIGHKRSHDSKPGA